MTVIEQLKHEAELLTEPLAQEVLDFLLFVRRRRAAGWPPGFFEETAGAWQGEPLERSPQGEQEQRLDLVFESSIISCKSLFLALCSRTNPVEPGRFYF